MLRPTGSSILFTLLGVASAVGCSPALEATESGGSGLTAADTVSSGTISLRARNGQYVQAVDGGGGELLVRGDAALGRESFEVLNREGHGELRSGDHVFLRAFDKAHIVQVRCGGGDDVWSTGCGAANAGTTNLLGWETLTLEKIGGTGPIASGDKVALRASNGSYCSALNGGGDRMTCAVPNVLDWETFTISFAESAPGPIVPPAPPPPAASGNFQLRDGKIFDPEGRLFVPMGFNAWPDAAGSADFFRDCWKANVVRLNHVSLEFEGWYTKEAMFATVDALTRRGIVAMIEWHEIGQIGDDPGGWNSVGSYDFGSSQGHIDAIKNFHMEFARRYVSNPYVWFNIINEPGSQPSASDMDRWANVSRQVIEGIRSTGNQNVIIADGMTWGQDTGWNTCETVTETDSAILSRGPGLAAMGNVAFNIHMYANWTCNLESRLNRFLDDAAAKQLSVFVGEYNEAALIRPASDVLERRSIGRLFWHVGSGDSPITTDGQSPNACSNPTNLNDFGRAVWDDMHR